MIIFLKRYDFINKGFFSNVGFVYVLGMCLDQLVLVVEDYFDFVVFILVVYELGYGYLKYINNCFYFIFNVYIQV